MHQSVMIKNAFTRSGTFDEPVKHVSIRKNLLGADEKPRPNRMIVCQKSDNRMTESTERPLAGAASGLRFQASSVGSGIATYFRL